jgi:hypothetical protein
MMNGRDNTHNNDENGQKEFDLTPEEKKALETLPRERVPSAELEESVVGALRDRGILVPPRRRVIELTARRIAAAVAACLVLIAVGFSFGQWVGARQTTADDFFPIEISDISVAATLQEAGSAYVKALQHLAALPDSVNGNQAVQGREVALTTLYTAADQVTRLVPKDELARQLLVAINVYPDAQATGEPQVIEF